MEYCDYMSPSYYTGHYMNKTNFIRDKESKKHLFSLKNLLYWEINVLTVIYVAWDIYNITFLFSSLQVLFIYKRYYTFL